MKSVFILFFAIVFLHSYSQTNTFPASGNVVIGTLIPNNLQGWEKVLNVEGGSHSKIIATSEGQSNRVGLYSHSNFGGVNGGFVGTESNHPFGFISGYTLRMVLDLNGNLGLGTTTPASKLHLNSAVERETFRIYKSTTTSNYLSIWQGDGAGAIDPIGTGLLYLGYDQSTNVVIGNTGGKLGIGTGAPAELLHVKSALPYPRISVQSTNSSGAPGFNIADATGNPKFTWHYDIAGGFMGFFQGTGGGNKMVIRDDGNVGIGTTTPGNFKLAVNGKIWGTEVQVALTNPGPDYVFEKSYALPTLEEVKSYIDQNKHLSEVPSAKEMEANGVNVGEMNMLLLKKIEELTLYVIDLKKESTRQQKEIEDLKSKK
jgi:hypothetical protein